MNSFTLADGRTLAYREAGCGRPIILLHGWSMSSVVFAEALKRLGTVGRILAPDLRGHGHSDAGRGYDFADLAEDLCEWIEGLGLNGAAVLGWSMGGQVAMALYPRVRNCVERLILIGTTPRFSAGEGWNCGLPDVQVKAMARNLKRNYLRTMSDFFALQFGDGEVSKERYRQILEFAVRSGKLPEPEVALASLETLRSADQRPLLGAIDCPVLVIHGGRDAITLPGAGRYLADRLPEGRLVAFPEAGHAPFLSRPDQCYGVCEEFLR